MRIAPINAETDASKGQRTATRILDAAECLFAQVGYEATTLRDIATAADIQQPGLYKYFDSKEALYRAVYERAIKPLTGVMESTLQHPFGPDNFRALTDALVDALVQRPHVAHLLIRSIIAPQSKRDEVGLDWINQLLNYGRRITEATNLNVDPDKLALDIVAVLNILFGYFWAASLVSDMSNKVPSSATMIAKQKDLLADFVAAMGATA